jgi:DNA-binding transcriptional LysR family regulator
MNIVQAMRVHVIEGVSFTILPNILIERELQENKLVRLLPEWSIRRGGVYTVTPPNRIRSNALQAFLNYIYTQQQ